MGSIFLVFITYCVYDLHSAKSVCVNSNYQLISETLSKYQQHIDSVLLWSTTTAIVR